MKSKTNKTKDFILHITPDEKFIDEAHRRLTSVCPDQQLWVSLEEPTANYKYLKATPLRHITPNALEQLTSKSECKSVIYHSLRADWYYSLNHINNTTKIIWIGWGFDYYYSILKKAYPNGLILSSTLKALRLSKARRPVRLILNKLRLYGKRAFERKRNEQLFDNLNRISYFSPVIKEEYELAKKYNSSFHAKYIDWGYQSPNKNDISQTKKRTKILLGNSADPANNHVELLYWLKKIKNNQEVICPLNYGNKQYAREITRIGHFLFKDRFKALTTWLPFENYYSILSECSHALFGHLRQQALGNIKELLANGTSVYMNQRSPLYNHLRKKGYTISPIDFESVTKTLANLNESDSEQNSFLANLEREDPATLPKTRDLIRTALSPE